MIRKVLKFFGLTMTLFILNFITLFFVLMVYSWAMNEVAIYLSHVYDSENVDYN